MENKYLNNLDFIEKNIGNRAFISGDGDLALCGEFREAIFKKTKFTIVKLTKKGMAYLMDDYNNFYNVPPRNVFLIKNDEL